MPTVTNIAGNFGKQLAFPFKPSVSVTRLLRAGDCSTRLEAPAELSRAVQPHTARRARLAVILMTDAPFPGVGSAMPAAANCSDK